MNSQEKLMVLANAIGTPEIDFDTLEYKFVKNTVMFVNKGHLVGIMHRQVYDSLMKAVLDEQIKAEKEQDPQP